MERINLAFVASFPNNCPIIEQNGDGREVGTCTYYAPNGVCPRHGNIKDRVQQAIDANLDRANGELPFTDPSQPTATDDEARLAGYQEGTAV